MTGDPIRYRKFDEDDAGSDLDLVGAMVPHEDGEWVRYDDHAAALAERDAEVAGLRALVKRVPGALNAAFSAGTEECERGSARRQAREMEKVDALREDVRVALSASPAPAQGVTITDEMVERCRQAVRNAGGSWLAESMDTVIRVVLTATLTPAPQEGSDGASK